MSIQSVAIHGVLVFVWASMVGEIRGATIHESARKIPVAYQVDVLVVGGSTGAVAAAVEAARTGAKVFLAAPHPYLGDDMTATLRLWLEPGEKPEDTLSRRIFRDSNQADRFRMNFTYCADRTSAPGHKDSNPPRVLSDCAWGNPIGQSVQYDGDVNLTLDLGKVQPTAQIRVMAYQAGGPAPYKVASVTAFTSNDATSWKEAAVLRKAENGGMGGCVTLSAPLVANARYVKLFVKQDASARRILLGEVEVIAPSLPGDPAQTAEFPPPRPMHVKKILDDALLEAGVQFLYNCYPTNILRDAKGNPCGIVMANRAGRQAVVAKTMIDATDRGVVARLAGGGCESFRSGPHTFRRVVIGGEPRQGKGIVKVREIFPPFVGPFPNAAHTSSNTFRIFDYTLKIPVKEDTPGAWAAVEQQARTLTYHPEQQFTSDDLSFQTPRPDGVPRLAVLSPSSETPGANAEPPQSTLALIDLGKRVGAAASAEAKSLPTPAGVRLPGPPSESLSRPGDVREMLDNVQPNQHLPTIQADAQVLPVFGEYDVVVIGGGTAGAPAGIAAGRQGARTLVVEHLHGLGGVGTVGAISNYWHGNRRGFTAEVGGGSKWVIEQKMEWFRSKLIEAGADVWFGAIGCGAIVNDGCVCGIVVATPQGRGAVLAKVVVDATGNADIAAAAGAQCRYTGAGELVMQGTGLPPRQLGATYTNTDFTITDETDLVDVWQLFVQAKDRFPRAFDLGQLVDTRERRMIVGDFTITILDEMAGRTYPDTIVQARTNYDTHSYVVDPYLLLKHPLRHIYTAYLPYRCLLPKGLEGILVAGLGISAHRDAQPLVRMQADIQNQGYAAGVAAAMAAKANVGPRAIDVRALQKHLVQVGCLPESVLTEVDSFPASDNALSAAVESIQTDSAGLALVMAHRKRALPLLRTAYAAAEGSPPKVRYAKVLGMLGDATGLATLENEVTRAKTWDTVPTWVGDAKGAGFIDAGWCVSPLDNTILALGRTRRPEAVPVILEKLTLLSAGSALSHCRAVALALGEIGDRSAAEPLARLLEKPGIQGYAQTSLPRTRAPTKRPSGAAQPDLPRALREVTLARALYRCGDFRGLGKKILTEYTRDLRGHFARHARAVLDAESGAGAEKSN